MLLASIVELPGLDTAGSRLDAGRAEHSEAVEYDAHGFRRRASCMFGSFLFIVASFGKSAKA